MTPTDHPGRILNDRYRLVARAGSGGMAHVWRAESVVQPSRTFAIKRPRTDVDDITELWSMFLDEARVTADLRHPNIVRCVDCNHDATGPYLVLEWVEGVCAREIADAITLPLPQEAVVPLGFDVLLALAESHTTRSTRGRVLRMPVIHRDISLSNVLVGVDGVAKLADFGLARSFARARSNPRGMARGKIGYLPPEVLRGGLHGVRGDLYSVGVVLWELLTGMSMFGEIACDARRARALATAPRPPVRSIRADVDADLAAIVDRALDLDPAARASRANDMAEALRATMSESRFDRARTQLAAAARDSMRGTPTRTTSAARTATRTNDPEAHVLLLAALRAATVAESAVA